MNIDDSIEPRPYTKTDYLINWHYEHCIGKGVKGVNFVSSFYYSPTHDMGLTVGVNYVLKDKVITDSKGKISDKDYKDTTSTLYSLYDCIC